MRKLMLSMLLSLAVWVGAQTTFVFSTSTDKQVRDNITVLLEQGAGANPPAVYKDSVRLYTGNTVTVKGKQITAVELTFAKQGRKDYASLTANTGTLVSGGVSAGNDDLKTDVWTGDASSVVFAVEGKGKQRVLTQVVVTGIGAEGGEEPEEIVLPDDLDPEYVYAEPEIIPAPEDTIVKGAYRFVESNIEIKCTQGTGSPKYGYFSCYANYQISFTAARPIKGLAINGMIKKDFSATVNHGEIEYAEAELDVEKDPVLIVRDVNAKSVTVTCAKQLRCYSVEVYFEENPEGIPEDVYDTVVVTPTHVQAEFYPEYSEEGSFSYWLKLFSGEVYPSVWLDIYSETEGELAGDYSYEMSNLGDQTYILFGDGDMDYAEMYDGNLSIEKTDNGYLIRGAVLADDDKVYVFEYEGGVEFSAVWPESIEQTEVMLDPDAPMYDVIGRRVNADYQGMVIQNKHIFMLR
ncbi:MAG: hypothetical protein IJP45_07665 [Paludibacteraceae bacterium]|nr:hypothetical protein [Paludibacteraceae bacterium]